MSGLVGLAEGFWFPLGFRSGRSVQECLGAVLSDTLIGVRLECHSLPLQDALGSTHVKEDAECVSHSVAATLPKGRDQEKPRQARSDVLQSTRARPETIGIKRAAKERGEHKSSPRSSPNIDPGL